MNDVLFLAWQYLVYHRIKTLVLVGSIGLIVYLPIGLNIVVSRSAQELMARAETTPLLVGAKGSPLELTLRSLYFESNAPNDMLYGEALRVRRSNLATAVPLNARFRTRHSPIVGTTVEYFEFRKLQLIDGRHFGMLGECVLGSQAAETADVSLGDFALSAPETVLDLAGSYPLKMKVVGVLKPTGTPDDRAVFVDIMTSWVIAGLGHGHQDLSDGGLGTGAMKRDENEITANAAVMEYNEITPENVASFHFHGDMESFPITSVLVVPKDAESSTILQGRYVGENELVQVVNPAEVIDDLLKTVLTVRRYLLIAAAIVGLVTCATMSMIFLLSWQLRRREMETILRIGGSRGRVASLVAAEVLSVIAAGVICAGLLAMATSVVADSATRILIKLT